MDSIIYAVVPMQHCVCKNLMYCFARIRCFLETLGSEDRYSVDFADGSLNGSCNQIVGRSLDGQLEKADNDLVSFAGVIRFDLKSKKCPSPRPSRSRNFSSVISTISIGI